RASSISSLSSVRETLVVAMVESALSRIRAPAPAAGRSSLRQLVRDAFEVAGEAHAGLEQLLVDAGDVGVLIRAVDEEEVVELVRVGHGGVLEQRRVVDRLHGEGMGFLGPLGGVARRPGRLRRLVEGEDAGVER